MATTLDKVDVVTVGVGWAGGIIGAECAKAGLKVLGLERGKARGTEDYSMIHDEFRYAIRYDLMQDLSKETITFRNHSENARTSDAANGVVSSWRRAWWFRDALEWSYLALSSV